MDNKRSYDEGKEFLKNKNQTSNAVENQNQHYNVRKEALGPNARRG